MRLVFVGREEGRMNLANRLKNYENTYKWTKGKMHKLHFLTKGKQPYLNYPQKCKVRKATVQKEKLLAQCCRAELEKESIS